MKKKDTYLQRGSTLILQATVIAMGLIALAICIFVLPAIHREWVIEFPDLTYLRYPVIIGLVTAAIAFWIALYQAYKLLNYIDKNQVFSTLSVKALKTIAYCAVVISAVFVAAMPLIYYIAENEDAPGLILFGMLFVCAPVVIAVFAAVLQKLVQNAIDLKSENDLTV